MDQDDDPVYRELVTSLLRENGINIIAVEGNDAALEVLDANQTTFDLIVQDCQRPLGRCLGGDDKEARLESGARFYEEILQERYPGIPVLVCAGVASPEEAGLPADVPFLAKTAAPRELVERVRSMAETDFDFDFDP